MDKGKQRVMASKPPPNPSSHNWALPKCWYHKYTRENSSYLHNNNTVNNENYLLHWPHPTKPLFIMNILQIGAKKWIRINENFKNYCPIAWNHVGRLVWAIWSFAIYFYVYLIEDGSVKYSYQHSCFFHFNLIFIFWWFFWNVVAKYHVSFVPSRNERLVWIYILYISILI
jgi:hypothetical protein